MQKTVVLMSALTRSNPEKQWITRETRMRLENYLTGQWLVAKGTGVTLTDPVTGEALVEAASDGIDLAAALDHARQQGGPALRALTHAQRGMMLASIAEVLGARRSHYFEISQRNSGATEADAGFDVDGAIFTLKAFARLAKSLGETNGFVDGVLVPLSKEGNFMARHVMTAQKGIAIFINAFNFPAWGLWEKAAPALLAGMPVFVKPATPTAWLAQQMVKDVVEAGILPAGAISIVCGGARDLLDHVEPTDVVSFTGSAKTAQTIKTHPRIVAGAVRTNIEADSVNALVVGPDAVMGSRVAELAIKEVVREMTIKAGQKCTAIRRIFVPQAIADAFQSALADKLARIQVGDPRIEGVRMGPLVSMAQKDAALAGIEQLKAECSVAFKSDAVSLADGVSADTTAIVPITLLRCDDPQRARVVHEVEVFGPVATLIPYADDADLATMLRRGGGSLVASIFSNDGDFTDALVEQVGDLHGRLMLVDDQVDAGHTGHGNVMPNCLHGGPGRAGGGEELGGLRALGFYLRRHVVQGSPARLEALVANRADAALLSA